jgi:hypothetical protein
MKQQVPKIVGKEQFNECPVCHNNPQEFKKNLQVWLDKHATSLNQDEIDEINIEINNGCNNCMASGKILRPYWYCEECGHTNYLKPMPKDRGAFYDKINSKGCPVCPRCQSESFMPKGY